MVDDREEARLLQLQIEQGVDYVSYLQIAGPVSETARVF